MPKTQRVRVLYFVRCGDFVKIGLTENLYARIKHLRNMNPLEPFVVAVFPGSRHTEKMYHDRFKNEHERREWFRYEGGLKDYLESQHPEGSKGVLKLWTTG